MRLETGIAGALKPSPARTGGAGVGLLLVLLTGSALPWTLAWAGELRIVPRVSVSEEYTTNVDLDPDGEEQSAFITRVSPGGELRGLSARTESAVDGELTFRQQTDGIDQGLNIDPKVNGFANAEVVRNTLFLESKASVSQQKLNNEETNSDANRQTTQIYSLSPSLRSRFDRNALGELRYIFDQVSVSDNSVSNETNHTGVATLSSGPRSERMRWTANGLASYGKRTESGNIKRKETELASEYALSRMFHAIGGVGYQSFDDSESVDFDSPTWRAGFRWRPRRSAELEFDYGLRDDRYSPRLALSYAITPRANIKLFYEETLSTSQERLSNTLGSIELDPETGELVDNRFGTAFNPRSDPLDIDDQTERVKAWRGIFTGEYGRNTISLQGGYFDEQKEETQADQKVTQADLLASRALDRHLSVEIGLGYERIKFDDGRTDNEYLARGGLRYELSDTAGLFASYLYRTQNSDESVNEFTEHRVSVGLRKLF